MICTSPVLMPTYAHEHQTHELNTVEIDNAGISITIHRIVSTMHQDFLQLQKR